MSEKANGEIECGNIISTMASIPPVLSTGGVPTTLTNSSYKEFTYFIHVLSNTPTVFTSILTTLGSGTFIICEAAIIATNFAAACTLTTRFTIANANNTLSITTYGIVRNATNANLSTPAFTAIATGATLDLRVTGQLNLPTKWMIKVTQFEVVG